MTNFGQAASQFFLNNEPFFLYKLKTHIFQQEYAYEIQCDFSEETCFSQS